MPPAPATWSDPGLAPRLAATRFADVRWFPSIDSTNRYALDAARDGVADGLVVVADHQSAGRGRLGRTWVSPPGASLLVSVLLGMPRELEDPHVLTMAAAVALAAAVEQTTGLLAGIKWPNDLVVRDRKLAGLLAEADTAAGEVRTVVVGAGCNVAWGTVPDELEGIATAIDLETGVVVDRGDLLVAYLGDLEARLHDLEAARAEYRSRLATLGRRVRVEVAGGDVVGDAIALGPRGELVVEADSGERRTIGAGDVTHLRPA